MEYYFAPMEGITGYVFRNAHHAVFPSMDRYYTPFITPKKGKSFTTRELKDVLPENNEKIRVIPQILTNQAEGFLKVAARLKEFGYTEVNLNLGCPSGTVVAKNKGAGFLAYPQELDEFLEQVFAGTDMSVSVKTRIGKEDPEEFDGLLEIFNRYPLEKLIIHPRLQTDFYNNTPDLEVFALAQKNSRNPVCYNGDLFSAEKIGEFVRRFPAVESVMLGRGMLVNPGLAAGLRENEKRRPKERPAPDQGTDDKSAAFENAQPDRERIRVFTERLAEGYARDLSGERDVLFKMKELWFYLGRLFPDGERYLKKLRKAERILEYQTAVNALFADCRMETPKTFRF